MSPLDHIREAEELLASAREHFDDAMDGPRITDVTRFVVPNLIAMAAAHLQAAALAIPTSKETR